MKFREWFTDLIQTHDFNDLYKIETSEYFKGITSPRQIDYWDIHLKMLEEFGIENVSKDIKILDIGTWFGIMPWALKKYGFTNISTTECYKHSVSKRKSFELLWKNLNIDPFELHILPQIEFKLPQMYDLITITKSNVFWKTDEVIHYDNEKVSTEWQIVGNDLKTHTFFTLYNENDWIFFIDNIKKYLSPNGVAIINPEPWCYSNIEYYKDTENFLKQFQTSMYSKLDNPLSNYLVIKK